MFIGHVTGYLGSDAKKTQKGYSFNVSTKYKEGNEEKTLWICCFLNYETDVLSVWNGSGGQVYPPQAVWEYSLSSRVSCFPRRY